MTKDFLDIQEFLHRLDLFTYGLIALFVIATVMTLLLLFWPFKEGSDE